ncbi:pantetheine-phosphate adenylyltransferase [Phaeocystidibacter luteus]|uniref:Phosphopantetheine adenylyltransferase n=1 Tax=Phaeocystidibacter luteus TaxID=911197 RepID=A0A6N6RJ76_9FLAO|nr:pantetheine-phosphate adenylyltransferase [Phaeocystidibacter luteus]KAB2806810.1 pantetheine-phosphate adenylyltransferase [Phaeocystidibacter luteus]
MARIALFPGSFDPITRGHENIISRALPLFDKIIVAVGQNANKKYMFSLEERMKFIEDTFEGESKIEVQSYDGLTVKFAEDLGANFLLRGLRNPADFEFEKAIAQANREMSPDMETVFLLTSARYAYISSSIVRDVYRNGGDYTLFVPKAVRFK